VVTAQDAVANGKDSAMSTNKFTDTQLVLLSAAAQHPEGALELSSDLKASGAKKVVGKLLREGLIEEVPARGILPTWRRDDNHEALALRITKLGLAIIGIEAGVAEPTAEAAPESQDGGNPANKRAARRVAAPRKKSKNETPKRSTKPSPRDSKQSRVIDMLQRRQGATIATIMKATGWQQHSVRGFLAGVVRKKLGLNLVSDKTDGARVYRIAVKHTPRKSKSGRKAA
jgi:hypothetical protein